MTFKLICSFFAFAFSFHAIAGELKPYPLGIVIRPSLIQGFFDRINTQKDGVEFDFCTSDFKEAVAFSNYRFNGNAKVHLSRPMWVEPSDDELVLTSWIDAFEISLHILSTCDADDKSLTEVGTAEIKFTKAIPLDFSIDLWKISSENEEDLGAELKKTSVEDLVNSIETMLKKGDTKWPELSEAFNTRFARETLINGITREVNRRFSGWLSERLRGLAYVDYVSRMFEQNEIWQSGVQVEKGAISLTNPGEQLRKSELAFGFYPRRDRFIQFGNGSIQLFFNAIFLDKSELDSLAGDDVRDERTRLSTARDRLLHNMAIEDPEFQRPFVGGVDADMTLILPESIINGALERFYREDLRHFTTSVAFGREAKKFITEEGLDVSLRIQLESRTAPKILFQSNRLNLSVSNYFLSIGTFIEDRLIPSTQVQAKVDISAGIDISGSTVNLAVQPSTFNIELDRGQKFGGRLSENDLQFLGSISNQLWKEFFSLYPKLPLFYTFFKTPNQSSEIQIVDLDVQNDLVLLHFNIDALEVKL